MRALRVGLVIAALGLVGARAHADVRPADEEPREPRDPREAARREFAAGQAADQRKDWRAAIEHYLRANDLVPHPFAVYNIAVNYERLGRLREAATWYERYLAQATDMAERERIQRVVDDLVQRPAPLDVRSVPAGARVYVDAIPVGETPYRGTLRRGFHRISVDRDGVRNQRDVTVEYGEPVSLEFRLRAPPGMVRVRGEPYGAAIRVDDRPAGRVPVRLKVEGGLHRLRVTSPGHQPFETTVNVEPNHEVVVDVQLVRDPGADPDASPGPAPGTRVIRAGYLAGLAGGADALGSGGLGLVELGIRIGPVDAAARLGRAADRTTADLVTRWTLTSGRIAPFLGAGFSFVKDGGGYALSGGLRWDPLRSEHTTLSVLAESGLRYFRSEAPDPAGAPERDSGFIVPLMASVLVVYK